MRNAREEARVLGELDLAEASSRPPSPEGVPMTEEQLRKLAGLRIDPARRHRG